MKLRMSQWLGSVLLLGLGIAAIAALVLSAPEPPRGAGGSTWATTGNLANLGRVNGLARVERGQ